MIRRRVIILILMISLGLAAALPASAQSGKIKNYMLVFDVVDYSAQVKETVEYFLKNVLQKGDRLIVVTPKRLIGFSPEKLDVPKKQLANDIVKTLKADITSGMTAYRTTIEEMKRNIQTLSEEGEAASASPKVILQDYKKNRQTLWALRGDIENKLVKYAKIFRPAKGDQWENHLVMILQKESRPIPDRETMNDFRSNFQDYGMDAQEVFVEEQNDYKPRINFKKLETAFKYANVKFHLMYLQPKQMRSRQGIEYVENSGDLYNAFSNVTEATGGIKLTTATPTAFFKKVERLLEGKVEVEVIDETVKEE